EAATQEGLTPLVRREQECNAYIPCGLLRPPIPASTNGPFDWDDAKASALLNPRRHGVAARCQLCGPFDKLSARASSEATGDQPSKPNRGSFHEMDGPR